jgi:hypothetical protein
MTIDQIISAYSGKLIDTNEFWPDGPMDDRERIVELPWNAAFIAFQANINLLLDENNPIQYISDNIPNGKRYFLYYAE